MSNSIKLDPDRQFVYNTKTFDFVKSAGRADKNEQLYGLRRELQTQTRAVKYALEQHRQYHIKRQSFTPIELNTHIDLISQGILNGMSFMQAHDFAKQKGPRAHDE